MQGSGATDTSDVLDAAQLARIEAVHKGFLYQHLYTVGCLLLAQAAEVQEVLVELDEDIELITGEGRIYIQVKTRSKPIIPSNISGALERFDQLRQEHEDGKRQGDASFVVIANQEPGPKLTEKIKSGDLPQDVVFISPQSSSSMHPALPPAWESVTDAAAWCISQAESLNFSLLSPDSLIWKLAGLAQLAATGSAPNCPHTFRTEDLSDLFEQLIVQLQEFPAPPDNYRPQSNEPTFSSEDPVRIICGHSGAGKTAWAAQTALFSTELSAYYDVGDLPGPALAATLVRELAAKFVNAHKDEQRKILLPGSSGLDSLRAFDTFLDQQGMKLLLVLDNAHRIPPENLRDVLNAANCIQFVLLCQPQDNVRELEALTGLQRESLLGWDLDTVAEAVHELRGFASAHGFEELRTYTGGLPLYVESAAKIAATEYGGDVDLLCADLHNQESDAETAQEVILSRVYQSYETDIQDALALFSLANVGLSRDEILDLLIKSLHVSKPKAASLLKKMRSTGSIEVFGDQTLKVHDAVRALGRQHLVDMDPEVEQKAIVALKELLIVSLQRTRDTSRFTLLTQLYIKLNDVLTLIALSGQELFFEMGLSVDITEHLELALDSEKLEPSEKFWALDGIVFSDLREGNFEKVPERLSAMNDLLSNNVFSHRENIAYEMKMIAFSGVNGDADDVERRVSLMRNTLPDAEHKLIFDYNHAIALFKLNKFLEARDLCQQVVAGFYQQLGIQAVDVIGKNPNVLWGMIERSENVHEHLKHLADALELYGKIFEAQGLRSSLPRIHSMKFYQMAYAPDSLVRVGQDLADEFVGLQDFEGAKEVLEQHVLPVVEKIGLIGKMIEVRSQYAVILAYNGQFDDANAEMQRLAPYIDGLSVRQRQELEGQLSFIDYMSKQQTLN